MNEAENNTQHQKSKFSKLAIASVSLGTLGISILVLRITLYRPWWSEFVGRNVIGLSGIVGLILGMAALARISRRMAAITALVIISPFLLFYFSALMRIRLLLDCTFYAMLAILFGLLIGAAVVHSLSRSRENFRGSGFIFLGIFLTTFLSDVWWAETCGPMSSAATMACGANLTKLGKAIFSYANQHQGQYPDPARWCDLLLKDGQVSEKHFFCAGVKLQWRRQVLPWPVPRKARCYYAMNPSCQPNSPPDMVLLFETKGGWNQFGGPEILTLDNHWGDRCNILFNDGHVEPSGRRYFGRLKWKVEQQNGKPGQSNSASWRMPGSDWELDYWLKNMVWYHRVGELSQTLG
jgi:prepilin-type processing-associated H-X9-DG protein